MRMRHRVSSWLVMWLLAAAAAQLAAFEVVRRVFVGTERGQLLDTAALTGNRVGSRHLDEPVEVLLSAMTVLSLAAAIAVIGFIALMRRRVALAGAAVLLIVGANLTTQLLKHGIERPEYGVDVARAAAGNSLPSGHTTVAASVAVALVLVLPPRLRGVAALLGAGYAGLAGVATLSADWHRPSDAVAALLIVGAWAALVGLLLAVAHRRDGGRGAPAPRPHWPALATLLLAAVVLFAVAAVAMAVTDRALPTPPEWFGDRRLLAAYAGGAAGIAGTAAVVTALVLASVHLAVPPRLTDLAARRLARPAGHAAAPPAASVARR